MSDPRIRECRAGVARLDAQLANLDTHADITQVRNLAGRRLALAQFLEAQGERVPSPPIIW